MIFDFLGLALGIALLVWSADLFVAGAASLARIFKVPALVIGMFIVGFGTSAPELLVSTLSSLNNAPLLALGNAYGSNITNILLILGVAVFVGRITVHSQVNHKELPLLLGVTLLTIALLLLGGQFSRLDGIQLLTVFAGIVAHSCYVSIRDRSKVDALEEELVEGATRPMSPWKAAGMTVLGLAILVGSSKLVVTCAIGLAQAFGVSELVIGLTIVAVGTSLPELMSTIVAVHRHEDDLAIGNIIGSNFFNTLAVAGLAVTIRPLAAEQIPVLLRYRDMGVMLLVTVLLFGFTLFGKYRVRKQPGKKGYIGKLAGTTFLLLYAAYTTWVVLCP